MNTDHSYNSPIQSGSRGSILRNLGGTPVILSGTIAAAGFAYVSLTLSARLLGTADFGLLGSLLALTSIASVLVRPIHMVATHLAGDAYVRGIRRADLPMSVVMYLFAATIVLLLLTWALRTPIQSLLRIDNFAPVGMVGLLIGAMTFWQIGSGLLVGLHRFHTFAVFLVAEAGCRALLTAPLIVAFGVAGSLGAYVAGVIAVSVLALQKVAALDGRAVSAPKVWSEAAQVARSTLVLTLAIAVMQNVDLVALRTYALPEDVGLYAAAAALGNVAFSLAAGLYLPFYPRVLAASRRRAPTLPHLRKIMFQVAAAGAVAILLAIPLGAWVAGLLFGQALAGAGVLLPMYLAKTTALLILFLLGQYAIATGRRFASAACLTPALVSTAVLFFAGLPPLHVPLVGLCAAAVGTVWLGWVSARSA